VFVIGHHCVVSHLELVLDRQQAAEQLFRFPENGEEAGSVSVNHDAEDELLARRADPLELVRNGDEAIHLPEVASAHFFKRRAKLQASLSTHTHTWTDRQTDRQMERDRERERERERQKIKSEVPCDPIIDLLGGEQAVHRGLRRVVH